MKLFTESYFGLHGKDEYRLYFEDDSFGLFIWLTPGFELKAFQADHKNRYAVTFNRPDIVKYGKVIDEPLTGCISEEIDELEIKILVNGIKQFEYQKLPVLFDKIKSIVNGQSIIDFVLPKKETGYLKSLKYKKRSEK
jgi:hypothetical protein